MAVISKKQLEEEKKHPEKLRSCYNCSHLKEVLSLWCTNKKAIKARGTQLPGCIHCPYWAANPDAQKIIDKNKTKELERGSYYLGILII